MDRASRVVQRWRDCVIDGRAVFPLGVRALSHVRACDSTTRDPLGNFPGRIREEFPDADFCRGAKCLVTIQPRFRPAIRRLPSLIIREADCTMTNPSPTHAAPTRGPSVSPGQSGGSPRRTRHRTPIVIAVLVVIALG